jgi:hypothetical protein
MKNSSDTIGNRTRDLRACSTVPQPTEFYTVLSNIHSIITVVYPYIQKRVSVHMHRAESARKDHPRFEAPYYETWSIAPLW